MTTVAYRNKLIQWEKNKIRGTINNPTKIKLGPDSKNNQ